MDIMTAFLVIVYFHVCEVIVHYVLNDLLFACFISIKHSKSTKNRKIVCEHTKIIVPLHRQKVNRLFRLVVIDLGF